MSESTEAYLQIGEVAERTGVTQRTLRFYEEKGLLRPPTRMEGGFRLYSEDDVNTKAEDVFRHVFRAYPTVPSPHYASAAA